MSDTEPQKSGFWTSLPGILTAAAGFIGAIAAVLALFVVPGGDSGGDSGDDGPSRAAWASEVNGICSDATDAVRRIPVTKPLDFNDAAIYLRQVSGITREAVGDIRAVPAPADDQANIDRMTLLVDQQADLIDETANSYVNGDQAGADRVAQQIKAPVQEANTLAASLGVTACAQSVQPTLTP
jgi:hypothetical protein